MSNIINLGSTTIPTGLPIVNYLTAVAPAGYATAFTALYQFDNSVSKMTDRMGNGHDLSTLTGTYNMVLRNGLVGWHCRENTYAYSAIAASLVSLTTVTLEVTTALGQPTTEADEIAGVHGSTASELEAENFVLSFIVKELTGAMGFLHEHHGGTNVLMYSDVVLPIGHLSYAVLTREADGVTYKYYIDGELLATVVASDPPTGGSNSRFCVGGYTSATDYYGEIFSVRYSKGLMTAAQIAEVNTELRSA